MKLKSLTTCAAVALTLGTGSKVASAQNLIINPGFEFGAAGYTIIGRVDNYTYDLYASINGLTGLNPALYGNRLAVINGTDLPPDGFISQTIPTTPGTSYDVNFLYGNFNISDAPRTQRMNVQAVDMSSGLPLGSVTAISSVQLNQIDLGVIFGEPNPYQFRFVASGDSTRIEFRDQTVGSAIRSDALLDNISVVAVAASAPEPGSLALFCLALPLAGIVLRRRIAQ